MATETCSGRCPVNHNRSALCRAHPERMGRPMSQRRSPAVRRRVTARRNLKTVATRPAWVWQQLPDEAVLDGDSMDAGLGEEVGCDLPWQSADVSETGVEVL